MVETHRLGNVLLYRLTRATPLSASDDPAFTEFLETIGRELDRMVQPCAFSLFVFPREGDPEDVRYVTNAIGREHLKVMSAIAALIATPTDPEPAT